MFLSVCLKVRPQALLHFLQQETSERRVIIAPGRFCLTNEDLHHVDRVIQDNCHVPDFRKLCERNAIVGVHERKTEMDGEIPFYERQYGESFSAVFFAYHF